MCESGPEEAADEDSFFENSENFGVKQLRYFRLAHMQSFIAFITQHVGR